MAPQVRRAQNNQHQPLQPTQIPNVDQDDQDAIDLFVDPMMGTPLTIFVEREVPALDAVSQLIKKHGGTIGPNYSTVQYILVDPSRESGQNLFRQYQNKKTKIVLSSQWVFECVKNRMLMTFRENWAGCKVTGEEIVEASPAPVVQPSANVDTSPTLPAPSLSVGTSPSSRGRAARLTATEASSAEHDNSPILTPQQSNHPRPLPSTSGASALRTPTQPQGSHLPPLQSATHTQDHPPPPPPPPFAHFTHATHHLPPGAFTPWSSMQPSVPGPSTSQAHTVSTLTTHQPPQQVTHLAQVHHRPPHLLHTYGITPPGVPAPAVRQAWYGVGPSAHPIGLAAPNSHPSHHPFSFDGSSNWDSNQVYYHPQFAGFGDPTFGIQPPLQDASNITSEAGRDAQNPVEQEIATEEGEDRGRKRKRVSGGATSPKKQTKYVPPIVTNPAALVPALAPPRRSPTPPSRVIKSTYGGNLFTAEDIEYLKKYIDWCVDMGEVLSLREICERLAIKAPHHTFYSWRRYCNKHKIKLGSYQMSNFDARPEEPEDDVENDGIEEQLFEEESATLTSGPSTSAATTNPISSGNAPKSSTTGSRNRDRSPTPPRSLHRSTTGKGIAFTDEDVRYLVKYLSYRRGKDPTMSMPQFWNDLAHRAPHHSRASWLKYWRRHKHEIEVDGVADGLDDNSAVGGSLQIPQISANVAKRQRYSQDDDVLLAKYFATNPAGTSDKVFQAFAKLHPHHPWKGWQEHHRIHKAQIDHYVKQLAAGVDLNHLPAPPSLKVGRPPTFRED